MAGLVQILPQSVQIDCGPLLHFATASGKFALAISWSISHHSSQISTDPWALPPTAATANGTSSNGARVNLQPSPLALGGIDEAALRAWMLRNMFHSVLPENYPGLVGQDDRSSTSSESGEEFEGSSSNISQHSQNDSEEGFVSVSRSNLPPSDTSNDLPTTDSDYEFISSDEAKYSSYNGLASATCKYDFVSDPDWQAQQREADRRRLEAKVRGSCPVYQVAAVLTFLIS